MSDLPRYREPMCGWPHGLVICEHGTPRRVCTDGHDDTHDEDES